MLAAVPNVISELQKSPEIAVIEVPYRALLSIL